jgi:hypothetical protein
MPFQLGVFFSPLWNVNTSAMRLNKKELKEPKIRGELHTLGVYHCWDSHMLKILLWLENIGTQLYIIKKG